MKNQEAKKIRIFGLTGRECAQFSKLLKKANKGQLGKMAQECLTQAEKLLKTDTGGHF